MKRIFALALLLAFFAAGCSMTDSDDDFIPKSSEDGSENGCEDGNEECSSDSKGKSSSGKKGNSSSSTNNSSSSSSKPSGASIIVPSTVTKGTFTDSRDGKTYKTVTIGTQTWMAENLNYETENSQCVVSTDTDCQKYGRKYPWSDLSDTTDKAYRYDGTFDWPFQGICPDGWIIPTPGDWITLLENTGAYPTYDNRYENPQALYVKAPCDEGGSDCGTDDYGFAINKLSMAYWTSRNNNYENKSYIDGYQRAVSVGCYSEYIRVVDGNRANGAASLRCIKRTTRAIDLNEPSTVKSNDAGCENAVWSPKVPPCNVNGVDNCVYGEFGRVKDTTVIIGDDEWLLFLENFNSYAKTHSPLSCPGGWHVPDTLEWNTLFDNVGGKCFAGLMLKSENEWSDGTGLNAYGLNIKPTGFLNVDHDYTYNTGNEVGNVTYAGFFTDHRNGNIAAFEARQDGVQYSNLYYTTANILCKKNPPVQDFFDRFTPEGANYGKFTDPRDGQTYKTAISGSQKWMAQNLNFKTDSSISYQDSAFYDYDKTFGQYYVFNEAKNACPNGWHLPSTEEFNTLFSNMKPVKNWIPIDFENRKDSIKFYVLQDQNSGIVFPYMGQAYQGHRGNVYHGFNDSCVFWTNEAESKYDIKVFLLERQSRNPEITTFTTYLNYLPVRCVNDTLFTKEEE